MAIHAAPGRHLAEGHLTHAPHPPAPSPQTDLFENPQLRLGGSGG